MQACVQAMGRPIAHCPLLLLESMLACGFHTPVPIDV